MSKVYDQQLQDKLRQYCDAIGSQAKAAAAIGISKSALSQYLRSIYDNGDVSEVENKIREHFRILEAQKRQPSKTSPFRIKGDYVPTSISEQVYKTIRYCQLEKGIMIVHGDAGIGKTMAAAKYICDNPTSAIYLEITPTTGTLSRFLKVLSRALHIDDIGDKLDLIEAIKSKLLGTNKVLIIDEAQHLKYLTIEEIRNWATPSNPITGQPGIGIVLIGNSQVYTRMTGRQSAAFAQQFSRSRHQRYSTTQFTVDDLLQTIPALQSSSMAKEKNFLMKICHSVWSLRSAVIIWNDMVNNANDDASKIGYNYLRARAQSFGIGVV